MSAVRAPRLAIALLLRFTASDPGLVGDLVEECGAGRSHAWCWRQVLVAIALDMSRTARRQPMLALRAVLVGWTAGAVAALTTGELLNHTVGNWVLDRLIHTLGSHTIVLMWAAVLQFWPNWALALVVSGWAVARLHRRAPALLLVFMVVVVVQTAYGVAMRWAAPPLFPIPFPALVLMREALTPVLIIFGGSLGAAPREVTPS